MRERVRVCVCGGRVCSVLRVATHQVNELQNSSAAMRIRCFYLFSFSFDRTTSGMNGEEYLDDDLFALGFGDFVIEKP